MPRLPWNDTTEASYRANWDALEVLEGRFAEFDKIIRNRFLPNKERYMIVEDDTGVPWFLTALLHMRESNNDFRGVLHNGEPIIGTGRKTVKVPQGRGPFSTWYESAIDAFTMEGRDLDEVDTNPLDNVDEWSPERILYEAERYNGFGYIGRVNSPYLWAGSQLYMKGKFTRDGHFDANHVDIQPGVASVLQRLTLVDEAVAERLTTGKPPVEPEPRPEPFTVTELTDLIEGHGWNVTLERVRNAPVRALN